MLLRVEADHEHVPRLVATMTSGPPDDMPGHLEAEAELMSCPKHQDLLLFKEKGKFWCPHGHQVNPTRLFGGKDSGTARD